MMVSTLTAPLARAIASCSPPPPPPPPPPKSSSSSSSSSPAAVVTIPLPLHHAAVSRRHGLSVCLLTSIALSFSSSSSAARAAILEADDDEELLERVKQDRKKRLQKQGVISSSGKETGYLQELVYKLSKVGQAIESNDLSAASSALGSNSNAEWLQNVNTAFMKLSSSPEEKVEVEAFNSSLVSLFASVAKRDFESSKVAFVSSASAFEKWIELTGLVGQLKGL